MNAIIICADLKKSTSKISVKIYLIISVNVMKIVVSEDRNLAKICT